MLLIAISGYGGKLGSTSALNLAQADLTFTPSKPQNGVNVPEQPTVSYTRPLTGMQTIPLELEKAFRSEGGKTSLNTQLLKVQKNGDMDYELTLRKTWSSPCNQITSFSGPDGSGAGEVFTVKAKKVLISLTKSALERVTFYDATGKSGLADTVKRLTDALDSAPALKYFAAYDDRWWETKAQEHPDFPSQEPFNVGRLTSSAYINNMFPWFPGTQDLKGVCPSNPDMGVIQNYITGFADLTYAGTLNQDFQNECNETEVDQCGICFNESTDFVGPATNHASKFLSEMMRYQLAVVFGFDPQEYEKHIPEPTEVRYQLWSNSNPVTQTDSCHYFKSGYEWWDLYEAARDLTGDGSLSLIGETMSYNWFWGEGALETTEYVLEEVYGLARPSWLTKGTFWTGSICSWSVDDIWFQSYIYSHFLIPLFFLFIIEEYCWAMPYWPSPRANPTGKSIMGDDTGSVTTNTSVTSPDSITSSSAVTTSSSFVAVSVAAAVFSLTVMLF